MIKFENVNDKKLSLTVNLSEIESLINLQKLVGKEFQRAAFRLKLSDGNFKFIITNKGIKVRYNFEKAFHPINIISMENIIFNEDNRTIEFIFNKHVFKCVIELAGEPGVNALKTKHTEKLQNYINFDYKALKKVIIDSLVNYLNEFHSIAYSEAGFYVGDVLIEINPENFLNTIEKFLSNMNSMKLIETYNMHGFRKYRFILYHYFRVDPKYTDVLFNPEHKKIFAKIESGIYSRLNMCKMVHNEIYDRDFLKYINCFRKANLNVFIIDKDNIIIEDGNQKIFAKSIDEFKKYVARLLEFSNI